MVARGKDLEISVRSNGDLTRFSKDLVNYTDIVTKSCTIIKVEI